MSTDLGLDAVEQVGVTESETQLAADKVTVQNDYSILDSYFDADLLKKWL